VLDDIFGTHRRFPESAPCTPSPCPSSDAHAVQVPSLAVPHRLVGATEIAILFGVSRQRVDQLSREDDTFPQATVEMAAGPVWDRMEVAVWALKTGWLK
jgi:hypothetical protein